jgi:hypothetical protein
MKTILLHEEQQDSEENASYESIQYATFYKTDIKTSEYNDDSVAMKITDVSQTYGENQDRIDTFDFTMGDDEFVAIADFLTRFQDSDGKMDMESLEKISNFILNEY